MTRVCAKDCLIYKMGSNFCSCQTISSRSNDEIISRGVEESLLLKCTPTTHYFNNGDSYCECGGQAKANTFYSNVEPLGGIKHDQGKIPLSILTKESLEAEAKALAYGAAKYGRQNYKKGMEWSRVIDATLRHITAFNSGEDFDPESGLNHIAHAKTNLAMLIYYYENKIGKDDRYKGDKNDKSE